jgi:hypothetical protein
MAFARSAAFVAFPWITSTPSRVSPTFTFVPRTSRVLKSGRG